MDSAMLSRFPFLRDASKYVSESGADIEMLISDDLLEDARKRGIQRVEDAIEKSEVRYVSTITENERLMEVLSYPYARMIVSLINDRFLTKRYALAESVRMNKLLGDSPLATALEVSKELGVNSTMDDSRLKMHFTDYLKFSTRIKSPDWKLINHQIYGGYVFLPHEKFDRTLQNALQDKIESELPLPLSDEIIAAISEDAGKVKRHMESVKSKFEPKFTGKLEDAELPPCIRSLIANAVQGVNLPHSGRFALVSFLHAIGMNSEQILTVFAQSPDFDESKSIYQIKHITGELNGTDGYTPPECHTMKSNGLCIEPDNLCNSEKMNHPLTYYRIKTNAPRVPKEN